MSGSLRLYLFRVPFLEFFFFCLFVLSYFNLLVFALPFIIFFTIITWKQVCFPMRDRKRVDVDGKGGGEELEGVEGGKPYHETLCEEKKSIFNKRTTNAWIRIISNKHINISFEFVHTLTHIHVCQTGYTVK